MDGTNVSTSASASSEHAAFAAMPPNCAVQMQQLVQSLPLVQPGLEYYYENRHYSAGHCPNCLFFSTVSCPYAVAASAATAAASATTATTFTNSSKCDESYVYYQLTNNVQSYRWYVPKMGQQLQPAAYSLKAAVGLNRGSQQQLHEGMSWLCDQKQLKHRKQRCCLDKWSPAYKEKMSGDGIMIAERGGSPCSGPKEKVAMSQTKLSNKMHPVQLLHQIFRKEAFVMEYERINDGPFSRVQVTYEVNGRGYVAEATRLKEARRLCAKQVLRDQFPRLGIESDDDIPQAEYDIARFDNKHPVQILYQIFRHEPMEMHCEEEGAAHFAKHLFTFVIRGVQYQAKAETIKEAKRRAAVLALNEYFKQSESRLSPSVRPAATVISLPFTVDQASSTTDLAPVQQHVFVTPVAPITDKVCVS